MTKIEKIIAKNVSISFEGYDNKNLKAVYMSEVGNYKGFTIEGVKHWVQGLPSVLSYPFYNYDIITMFFEGGLAAAKHSKNHDVLIEQYWDLLAELVFRAMQNGLEYRALEPSQCKRINNDYYGNPRYALHYLGVASNYNQALRLSKSIGGKKYHNKNYGGGIAFQSYNIEVHLECLNKAMLDFSNWV